MFFKDLLPRLSYIERNGPIRLRDDPVIQSLSKKEEKELYDRLIDILNFIFKDIPKEETVEKKPYLLKKHKAPLAHERESEKQAYKIYSYDQDFKKCTFLYCYTVILCSATLGSEAKKVKAEVINLFSAFADYSPNFKNNAPKDDKKSSRKTHPNKSELIDNYYSSIDTSLIIDKSLNDLIINLKNLVDNNEKSYTDLLDTFEDFDNDKITNLLSSSDMQDFKQQYFSLVERYEEKQHKLRQEFFNLPFGKEQRFFLLTNSDAALLTYLFELNYNHTKDDQSILTKRKNQRNWSLLSKKERLELANLLYDLDDADKSYHKYICGSLSDSREILYHLIAEICDHKYYSMAEQLKDMLNVCIYAASKPDVIDKASIEAVSFKLNKLYDIFQKLQDEFDFRKKDPITEVLDEIYPE